MMHWGPTTTSSASSASAAITADGWMRSDCAFAIAAPVAGAAIDFDHLAVETDAQLGEVGVIFQLTDVNVAQLAPHVLDDAGDQIVGQGPRRRSAANPAVDAGRLEDADHDGEAALALHFP